MTVPEELLLAWRVQKPFLASTDVGRPTVRSKYICMERCPRGKNKNVTIDIQRGDK